MRGGCIVVSKEELAKIPEIIESLGHVLMSKHQTGNWKKSEGKLTETEIHDRDYAWLKQTDLVISEISNPSLGVGGEISDAVALRKPVLCLFKEGLDDSISAYIRGKMGSKFIKTSFEVVPYKDLEDARKKIKNFIDKASLT